MHTPALAQRGFTLLEILVVVVIIGILTALMLPNLSSGGRWRDLQRETATLTARIRVAQDDAMLYGREYGIVFNEDGYRFVNWDVSKSAFRDPDSAGNWTLRKFDDGMSVSASADGNDPILVLPEAEDAAAAAPSESPKETEPVYEPSVYVLSSGEVTPFTAVFSAEGEEQTVELRIDALGNRVDESKAEGAPDAPSS
jgi:general secretion pathway protein H